MAWDHNVLRWLSDLVGAGEEDGWGVSDTTGSYSGSWGTGAQGSGYDDWQSYNELLSGGGGGAFDFSQYTDPEYFQDLYDQALTTAEGRFGSGTGQTAEEWLNQAGDLQSGYQDYADWMASQGYAQNDITGQQEGLQALIDQLVNMDENFGADAYAHAARLMGYTGDTAADDFAADIAGMRERQMGENAIDNYAGLSEEDRALRERLNQSNMREMEARAQRLVQNQFADTGSTARMLAAADEANSQMANVQLQQDMQLASEDLQIKMTNMAQESQMLAQMVQTNQIGYSDFMQMKEASLNAAMQGYSQQINAMLSQNAQYLQEHQQDMDLITAQVTQMQNMAATQLGIDQAILDAADQIYSARVQPIVDSLQTMLTEQQISQNQFDQIMDLILGVGGILVAI